MKKSLQQVHNTKKTEQGFALLIGVMVASILISITYVMFSISLKQIALATSGRDSQVALYAADTGLECALYEDLNTLEPFVKYSVDNQNRVTIQEPTGTSDMKCNSAEINRTFDTINGEVITTFSVAGPDGSNWCADVKVTKFVELIDGFQALRTKIESRGYNICDDVTDPQRLERGLEVYYGG
jgi:hypothetical protein